MTDVHDKRTRSYNMSRILGYDTKPEMLVRKFLHGKGFRYSLHNKRLPGKPDMTFKKFKTVIFINGCFWHGHQNCDYFKLPGSRTEWWKNKIEATVERDIKKRIELEELGWHALVVWECELRPQNKEQTLERLFLSITKEW